MNFINSIEVECLKTRRSAASWLCLTGGFFLPLMALIGFLKDHKSMNDLKGPANSWLIYFTQLREFLVIALLPMGIILATSLITQTEYRNHTWKQVHTTPQTWITIFSAKLAVLFIMITRFFIFFNTGVILAGVIPALLFDHALPRDSFPLTDLALANLDIFTVCLPVIALQYLFSLQFRNFMIPLGLGLLLWIGSIILVHNWQYAWISPYSYTTLLTMKKQGMPACTNIFPLSLLYFVVFTLAAYGLYYFKKDKS